MLNLSCYLEHISFVMPILLNITVLGIFIALKGHPSVFFMVGRIIISRDKTLGRGAAAQSYPVGAVRTYGSIFSI